MFWYDSLAEPCSVQFIILEEVKHFSYSREQLAENAEVHFAILFVISAYFCYYFYYFYFSRDRLSLSMDLVFL